MAIRSDQGLDAIAQLVKHFTANRVAHSSQQRARVDANYGGGPATYLGAPATFAQVSAQEPRAGRL